MIGAYCTYNGGNKRNKETKEFNFLKNIKIQTFLKSNAMKLLY